jgi:TRAP-type C4-dicarboxylate transport system permease small subunit
MKAMRTLKAVLALAVLATITGVASATIEPAHPVADAVTVAPQIPGSITSAPTPSSMLIVGGALIAFGSVLRRQLSKNVKAKRL